MEEIQAQQLRFVHSNHFGRPASSRPGQALCPAHWEALKEEGIQLAWGST